VAALLNEAHFFAPRKVAIFANSCGAKKLREWAAICGYIDVLAFTAPNN
jgi:hypothetical protein